MKKIILAILALSSLAYASHNGKVGTTTTIKGTLVTDSLNSGSVTYDTVAADGMSLTYGVSAATGVFSGAISATTLNTGQGAYELYAMNQNVQTTDNVTHLNITGTNGLNTTYGVSAATGVFTASLKTLQINANSNAGLKLYDDATNGIFIEDGGNIGIGTTDPRCAFDMQATNIFGYTTSLWGNNFAATDNDFDNATHDTTKNVNAFFYGALRASAYYASSDERIKKEINTSNNKNDLDLINKLRVVDYKYIDVIDKGSAKNRGFIAQEVEKIFPEAISKNTDFTPSIYAIADEAILDNSTGKLTIVLLKKHNLVEGDIVKIITTKGMKECKVVKINTETVFTVDNITKKYLGEEKKIFVYGKLVSDFQILDYDYIFSVGISAIQALSNENKELRERLEKLELKMDYK